jgi:hypothetical protein
VHRPPACRDSKGMEVVELWMDEQGQVAEGWVRRQMTEEEREVLGQAPACKRPAVYLDEAEVHPFEEGSAADVVRAEQGEGAY